MAWNKNSKETIVWIFPVGRGNAAFVRTGLNHGFILDMGGGEFVDPSQFIKENFLEHLTPYESSGDKKIAQAVLSHPHEDHIKQCKELSKDNPLEPGLITCPHDKDCKDGRPSNEKLNWERIEHEDKSNSDLLDEYRSVYEKRSVPLQTIKYNEGLVVPNLEYGIYYVRPPVCDEELHKSDNNKYGNSTSIITYLRHGEHSILFPGDITPEAMEHILEEKKGLEKRFTCFESKATNENPEWNEKTLDQPKLKNRLKEFGLTILVAPHHGLESCYSEELYGSMRDEKPDLVVISERRKKGDGDGSVDSRYQSESGSKSLKVTIDGKVGRRRSLSTVNGHNILIKFSGSGAPKVFSDKNPKVLLDNI